MRPAKWFCTHVFVFSCLLFCGRIHYVMCNTTYVIRKDNTDKFGSVHNPNECFRKYANIVYVAAKECQCPYAKSTYFHFKNACVNNYYFENELKTQSVCPGGLLRIQSEPYPVFDLTNSSSSSLKYVKTFDSQCSLENLHYLDESSGKLINAGSLIAKLFSLEKRTKTTVHLLWRSTYVSSFLKGRVVLLEFNKNCKVEMQFSSPSFGTKPCIIFKSLGTLTFNQSPTWSSSPPSNHRKRNKTEKSSSIKGLIVGPLVIFLGVVVLVLIVVLIYRKVRQKSRQRVNATQNSKDELADDFDMDGNPRSNVSQTSNQSGAEEMYMNTIPDLPRDPAANAANISRNAHGNSQTVELQLPELYESMKDDVLQYDYASVNGVPGSNQNIPKGMQQIPGAFEYDYVSVNGEPRSNQNKSAEGMQQRSIPDAFEYDYVAMDGDLRFVNNRTKGMCQHSIPVSRTHNKEDIPDPANHEPNEYINKKDEPEDGLSSESAYQPLQIKSPEDGVYQSLDKTSRAVNASERR